eukprot:CAMPEP_0171220260 /NCGR_PEP_ID=MMETSP0790-20130122/34146_1 /TAXON_ID=2925 /ORGANISM="Alexandrium catenella, Strain OF101" /LENGTH=161 /DNA_ID=CAMNT_0011686149 /DNA_START=54 /DNA_END=536 /DNA_ORIENTATION=+
MMKGLQAEIDGLRADLRAEKNQRLAEAKRHEEQLGWLREAVARERSERDAAHGAFRTLLSDECARSKAETQDLRVEMAAYLRQRTELADFHALYNRVSELAQMVEDEVRTREVKCGRLDELIAANTTADTHFAKHALQELAETKEALVENTAFDQRFQGSI